MQIGTQPVTSAAILAGLAGRQLRATNFIADAGGLVGWASRTLLGAPADATLRVSNNAGTTAAFLAVDGNDIMALRNGTNAQWFNIYNTYTDGLNYERARFQWSGNVFNIRADAAGTGTVRILRLGTNSVMDFDESTGIISASRATTSAPTIMQFNSAGITSTAVNYVRINPSINQASGSYTMLDINPTETAVGAGPHYLLRGRIGAGADVFRVTNGGNVLCNQLLMTTTGSLIQMAERSDPGASAANTGYVFMRDNGSGKVQFVARFPTGAVQVIATEP